MKHPNPTPTAEEILKENCNKVINGLCDTGFINRTIAKHVLHAMNEFATLKTKPLEDEIEGLKASIETLDNSLKKQYEVNVALTVKADLLEKELKICLNK